MIAVSVADEQAKHEALEQYAQARDRHASEAADLLLAERFAWWYVEVGTAEMLQKRMFEELETGHSYRTVPHG